MLYKTLSAAVYGIDANIIQVEVDCSGIKTDQDHFHTVGLPDAALAHSRIGQSDSVKVVLVGLNPGTVHLHLNNIGIDAVDCGAEGLVEHVRFGRDSFVPPSAHQGLIPEFSYLTRSEESSAVTDVTSFTVDCEENLRKTRGIAGSSTKNALQRER